MLSEFHTLARNKNIFKQTYHKCFKELQDCKTPQIPEFYTDLSDHFFLLAKN